MTNLKYHGLFINSPTHGELRFGIIELINRRQSWLWVEYPNLTKIQHEAIRRFHKSIYWQCAAKCHDTAMKLCLSMYKLSCDLIIIDNKNKYCFDGAPLDTAAIYFQAMNDVPYHLDSFISYLRILADCICFALPFFYQTKEHIPSRSFRDQIKWFIKTKPDFDPEYAKILNDHTYWFDLLAGKSEMDNTQKGIRDLNFHNFAIYQLGFYPLPNGQHQISISQVVGSGIAHQNILSTIEEIIQDFFEYLDLVYKLFIGRFLIEIPEYDWDSEDKSVLMGLEMEDIKRKYRFFPLISSG